MAWDFTSESGKKYSFADDVDPELANQFINQQEKPATWSETLSAVPETFKAGAASLPAGVAQLAGDTFNVPSWKESARLAQQGMQESLREATPANMSLGQEIVLGGVSSVPSSLLYAGGAMLTGGGTLAAGLAGGMSREAAMTAAAQSAYRTALATIGGAEGLKDYGQSRYEGMGVGKSLLHASVVGAAEAGGEAFSALPLKRVFAGGSLGELKSFAANLFGREIAGEEMTMLVENLNDMLLSNQHITLGEAAKKLAHDALVTAGSTAISGPIQVGGLTAAGKVFEAGIAPLVPVAATPMPIDVPIKAGPTQAPPPDVLTKTHSEKIPVWDAETMTWKSSDDLGLTSNQLPFEQRLSLLRDRESQLAQQTGPGFNAGAEETVAYRKQLQQAQENLSRERQDLVKQLVADPTLMRYVQEEDLKSGRLPGVEDQLQRAAIETMRGTTSADTEQKVATGRTLREPVIPLSPVEYDQRIVPELLNLGVLPSAHTQPTDLLSGGMYNSFDAYVGYGNDSSERIGMPLDGLPISEAAKHMQPGEVAVFLKPSANGLPGVDTQIDARQLAPIRDMLQSWVRAIAPEMKIALGVQALSDSQAQGRRSFVSAAAPDTLFIMLPVPEYSGQSGGKAFVPSKTAAYTLAHEFGHAFAAHEFFSTDQNTKTALVNEYRDVVNKLADMNFSEGIKVLAATSRATELRVWAMSKGLADKPFFEAYRQLAATGLPNPDYYLSFDEYLAESMVKYMVSRGGVTEDAKGFFGRVLEKLAKLYNSLQAHFSALPVFTKWVDSVVLRNLKQSPAMNGTSFQEVIANARKAGIDPSIVQMFKQPGSEGVDPDFFNSFASRVKDAAAKREAQGANVYANALNILRAVSSTMSNVVGVKDKSKAALLKQLRASLRGNDQGPLMKAVYELAETAEFAGNRIDPQKFLAVVMTKLGNWRPVAENVVTTPDMTRVRVNLQVGLPSSVEGASYEITIKGGIAELTWNDELAAVQVEENIPRALSALLTAAKYGAKTLTTSAKETAPLTLRHALSSFTQEQKAGVYEVPYWAFEMNDNQGIAYDVRIGGTPSSMMAKLAHVFGLSSWRTQANDTARFNRFLGKALGAFQMAKLNMHVPGVPQMLDALRNRMRYKAEWLRPADDALKAWSDLPKAEVESLSRLLYEEAVAGDLAKTSAERAQAWMSIRMEDPEKPGRSTFMLKPEILTRYGLSEKAAEVYSQIRSNYLGALDEMHKVGLYEISRQYFSDVGYLQLQELMRQGGTLAQMNEAINRLLLGSEMAPGLEQTQPGLAQELRNSLEALDQGFQTMREKPYTPYPRFGKYGVLVTDTEGKTQYFETFENKKDADAAFPMIQEMHSGMNSAKTYVEDIPYALTGMPPAMVDVLAKSLQLSPDQQKSYRDFLIATSNANTFLKKMKRRKGVEGYSMDAMRGFADYFRRYANHIARVKSTSELSDALKQLKAYGDALARTDSGDARTAQQLHEWYTETVKYINEPGTELSELKSFVSLWHFGFNVSSATMNLTQVPFVTLPYLSERHGIAATLKELKRAYVDMAKWKSHSELEEDLQWAIEKGLNSYFLEESFATEIAQIADGSMLTKVSALSKYRKGVNTVNHYAMWMFQKAETLNRRTTFIASFRLAKQMGQDNENAFDYARSAVETTQNEYAIEARPNFMRGNWSVVFQFMQFSQNMLFQMLGGDASWKRLMLVQLFLGGLMGMPFAEDIGNLVKALARNLGMTDLDLEREGREMLVEHGLNADLAMRGLLHNVFGFDASSRVSLGQILPGMAAIGSNQSFNDSLAAGAGDMAGPGVGLLINAMRAVGENDPRTLHRMQYVMPTAMKNLSRAVSAEVEGGVQDRIGAMMYDPDIADAVGYATGFIPAELQSEYNARNSAQEEGKYWTTRRATLISEYRYLHDKGDQEGLLAFADRLQKYNASIPDPGLKLGMKSLRESLRQIHKQQLRREAGLGPSKNTQQISQDAQGLYGG